MDIVNFPPLVVTNKILDVSEIGPNDLIIVGKYQADKRNGTQYPNYAIPASQLIGGSNIPTLGTEILLGKITADLNTTADQIITLAGGITYLITNIIATNASVAPVTVSEGMVADGAARTGYIYYTSLDITIPNDVLNQLYVPGNYAPFYVYGCWPPPCNAYMTVSTNTLYFSLTTPEGSPVTCDLYVFGKVLN